jgi:wobble nucleotide-excising tRNase
MLDRVSRLKNYRIFRDFEWPDGLADFAKFNLIYGWNGSGKTTLSSILRALELREEPYDVSSAQEKVELRVDGNTLDGTRFPDSDLPIRVFDRNYVNDTVFRAGGGNVPFIFVIGKENVEKQKVLDELVLQHSAADTKLQSAKTTFRECDKALGGYCKNRATQVREEMTKVGDSGYKGFHKGRFRERAEEMLREVDVQSKILTDKQIIDARSLAVATKPKPSVVEVTLLLPSFHEIAATISELLERTVVSGAIKSLEKDLELHDWTRRGFDLHRTHSSSQCLYCGQAIPNERVRELERHFSAEHGRLMDEINTQIQRLQQITDNLNTPEHRDVYDDVADEYDRALKALEVVILKTREFIGSVINKLEEKRIRAFDSIPLAADAPEIDVGAVEKLNEVIRKHNRTSEDFEKHVSEARDSIADHSVASTIDGFVLLKEALSNAEFQVEAVEGEYNGLEENIATLASEIKTNIPPKEEMNGDLRVYLGHNEIRLETKDTGYAITRNGNPATNPSEGERTAIALIYFLKSLEDESFKSRQEEGIVVLDDPVTSLDSNSMYHAVGFVRNRTKGVRQLFVLTHNFTLFRVLRRWLDPKVKDGSARLLMLECLPRENGRSAVIREIDPLLRKYESEYHYLFSCVYQNAKPERSGSLKNYYHMPNIARRVLETFFAFHFPNEDLFQALEKTTPPNTSIARSIYRYVNEHSHEKAIGEPEHDLLVLGGCQSTMLAILDLIEKEDPKHFLAMEKLVKKSARNSGGT